LADKNFRIGVVGTPGKWSTLALVDAVRNRTGGCTLVDMASVSASLSDGRVMYGDEDLAAFDALIIKKIDEVYSPAALDRLEVLRYLERRGVRIFSKPSTLLGLIDRLSCTVTLSAGGIAMPETVITEDTGSAADAILRFGKAVLKPLFSTKARGMAVISVDDDGWRRDLVSFAEKNRVLYVQKMLHMPGRDLGVAFLGGQHVATYARVGNEKSWNTTINSGGKYEAVDPSAEIIELATRAQALFDLDFTCVDVVETDDGPLVFEVSAFGGFRGLKDAHGIDAAAIYTDYVMTALGTPIGP